MNNPFLEALSSKEVPLHLLDIFFHAEAGLQGLRGINYAVSNILSPAKPKVSSVTFDDWWARLAKDVIKARDRAVAGIALLPSCLSDLSSSSGNKRDFNDQSATCTHELVLYLARREVKKFFNVFDWGTDIDDEDQYVNHCERAPLEELMEHLTHHETRSMSLSETSFGIDLPSYRQLSMELRRELLQVANNLNEKASKDTSIPVGTQAVQTTSDGKRTAKRTPRKKFMVTLPRNRLVLDLYQKIENDRKTGNNQTQIESALEFTNGNKNEAQSLLRQVRRFRNNLDRADSE